MSTGLLFTMLASEGTAGAQHSSQAQPQNSFTLSLLFQYLKLLSPANVTKFLGSSPAAEDHPTLEVPARTFSRGKPLGLKCRELSGAFL